MSTDDEKLSALLRKATAFKDSKQWPEAIAALYEAKKLMLVSPVSYPIETWCKLPLYLQQADLFAESMAEFQFLRDDLERRARHDSMLDDPDVGSLRSKRQCYEGILSGDPEMIEEKQALATQREAKRNR